jgi:hypothetical protein
MPKNAMGAHKTGFIPNAMMDQAISQADPKIEKIIDPIAALAREAD